MRLRFSAFGLGIALLFAACARPGEDSSPTSPDFSPAALEIQPGIARGLVVRGRTLLMLYRYAEAELDLRQVADEFPRDASNLFALGEALRLQGKRAEAIATFSRVLELQPGYPNAQKMLQHLQGNG